MPRSFTSILEICGAFHPRVEAPVDTADRLSRAACKGSGGGLFSQTWRVGHVLSEGIGWAGRRGSS